MEVFFVAVSFSAGFAGCWFSKETIMVAIHGAHTTIQKLEDKIRSIKAVM